ncbi:MAG TPA: DUF1254 domain-containing protein [Allosphingosinicella sp.]|nr:DUF1254 domain-containing protein [Allosphingosinicella sp.]
MIRILLLIACLFLGAAPSLAADRHAAGVRDAFLFGFPVHQMAVTRDRAIKVAEADGRTVVNRFGHRSRLTTPSDRLVTTPNNDTLYSAAWLDLAAGPVILDIPALADRYHSVALLSLFTDNFAVLGTRSTGGRGGRFLVAGPAWKGAVPKGMRLVRAPTSDVWAIIRMLVGGPEDLAAAVAAQTAITVSAWGHGKENSKTAPSPGSGLDDPEEFLATVNAMLARGPLPRERARRAAALSPYGVRPGDRAAFRKLSPEIQAEWRRAMPRLRAEIASGFASVGTMVEGWSYPRPGMGDFRTDDFYRSAIALGGLAALPAEEAVYFTGTHDSAGNPLDGSRSYTIRLPANVPIGPAGFWSLTIYELTPDGRQFFTENPIGRYAIRDRTAGLVRNGDGTLDILIQNTPPADGTISNWLPAPPGPFRLNFRTYLPGAAIKQGRWRMPPVIQTKPAAGALAR